MQSSNCMHSNSPAMSLYSQPASVVWHSGRWCVELIVKSLMDQDISPVASPVESMY